MPRTDPRLNPDTRHHAMRHGKIITSAYECDQWSRAALWRRGDTSNRAAMVSDLTHVYDFGPIPMPLEFALKLANYVYDY